MGPLQLAKVPEDIPLNYIRTAVLHVSDPHFSVSALLMYGMVYQQTLILAHLEILPAQLNSRIYLYFKSVIISSFLHAECVNQTS